MSSINKFSSLRKLFFILFAIILINNISLGGASPTIKRSRSLDNEANSLEECLESGGMKRQLRSEGLNTYLFGLAKCVASIGRPRFGKRNQIFGLSNQSSNNLEVEDLYKIIKSTYNLARNMHTITNDHDYLVARN